MWDFFPRLKCFVLQFSRPTNGNSFFVRGLEPIGFDLWEFDPESPQYIPFCFESPTNLRRPFGVRCCYNGFLTYIQDAQGLVVLG